MIFIFIFLIVKMNITPKEKKFIKDILKKYNGPRTCFTIEEPIDLTIKIRNILKSCGIIEIIQLPEEPNNIYYTVMWSHPNPNNSSDKTLNDLITFIKKSNSLTKIFASVLKKYSFPHCKYPLIDLYAPINISLVYNSSNTRIKYRILRILWDAGFIVAPFGKYGISINVLSKIYNPQSYTDVHISF